MKAKTIWIIIGVVVLILIIANWNKIFGKTETKRIGGQLDELSRARVDMRNRFGIGGGNSTNKEVNWCGDAALGYCLANYSKATCKFICKNTQ